MNLFAVAFLVLVFCFILFLAVTVYNDKYSGNPKAFFKEILKLGLYILGMLLFIVIFIIMLGVFYKVLRNLFVASLLTVVVGGLIVNKILDR